MPEDKDEIIGELRGKLEAAEDELLSTEGSSEMLAEEISELEAELHMRQEQNQQCFYAGRKSLDDISPLRSWLKYKNEVGL